MATSAAIPPVGPDMSLLISNSEKEFQAWSPAGNSALSTSNSHPEDLSMSTTSPALGSNLASRAMPSDPPGNMAPSDAAASKPTATKTASTIKVAITTMANAVVERWADMIPNQGDFAEPMHVKGA